MSILPISPARTEARHVHAPKLVRYAEKDTRPVTDFGTLVSFLHLIS